MPLASIDIGSNAVRLLISEPVMVKGKTEYIKKQFIRVPLRLGESAFSKKMISDQKRSDLLKTLQAFKNMMEIYRVKKYMACATAAMREAKNGKEIVQEILEKLDLKIEIIEGKLEAEIIYNNHIEQTLPKSNAYMYIDVGGGSTEITLFNNGKVVQSASFSIGTIKLLMKSDVEKEWTDIKNFIKTSLSLHKDIVGIGTGGNINKLAKIIQTGKKDSRSVTFAQLKKTYNYLIGFTVEERIKDLGMNEDRADVIVPAGYIFLNIMKWANMEEIYVPRIGLADGIIHLLNEK